MKENYRAGMQFKPDFIVAAGCGCIYVTRKPLYISRPPGSPKKNIWRARIGSNSEQRSQVGCVGTRPSPHSFVSCYTGWLKPYQHGTQLQARQVGLAMSGPTEPTPHKWSLPVEPVESPT